MPALSSDDSLKYFLPGGITTSMSIVQRSVKVYREEGAIPLSKKASRRIFDNACGTVRGVLGPVDETAGAKIYSNCSGFSRNVTGDIAEFKSRMRVKPAIEQSNPEIDAKRRATELRDYGYTELGQIYPDEIIETLKPKYDRLLEEGTHTEVQQSNAVGEDRVFSEGISDENLQRNFTEAHQLISPEIIEVLRHYYQAYIKILKISAYRTHHIPAEIRETTEVYNENWHFDGSSTDHIKLFVTLSDTTEDDGPLHILPKPGMDRIASRRPHFDREADGDPGGIVDELGTPMTLTGPTGTAMLANTQSCLHRAGVPAEGHQRDLIQFYIAPSARPLEEDWISKRRLTGAEHNLLLRLFTY